MSTKPKQRHQPGHNNIQRQNIPDHEARQVTQEFHVIKSSIPPAPLLEEWDRVCPGSAREIMDDALEHTKHLRKQQVVQYQMAQIEQEQSYKKVKQGRVWGFIVIFLILAATIFCVIKGAHAVAGMLAGSIIALGSIFALGKTSSLRGIFSKVSDKEKGRLNDRH